VDNDCDGIEDEDLPLFNCYTDADGDGHGDPDGQVAVQCECGPGSAPEGDDCNDDDPDVYTDAPDICDDVLDNDCDGAPDPQEVDDDGDGYTECEGDCDDGDSSLNLDDVDGDGADTCAGDCDDGDPAFFPAATEACEDGADNDCDAATDCDDPDCDWDPVCPFPVSGYLPIVAGTFTMGSAFDLVGHNPDELQREVTLTTDFHAGETEVTQGPFETLMGWHPGDCLYGCGDDYPVHNVNWYEALAFANEMSTDTGRDACFVLANVVCVDGSSVGLDYMDCMNASQQGIAEADVSLNGVTTPYECEGFRLPMEAEWEYMARAGETAAYPNGGSLFPGDTTNCFGNLLLDNGTYLDDIAWYCGNEIGRTREVGGLLPNNWGLYDVSGNVWEWVWDWHEDWTDADVIDPTGPGTGNGKVVRGGSWYFDPQYARVSFRTDFNPFERSYNQGFRLVVRSP